MKSITGYLKSRGEVNNFQEMAQRVQKLSEAQGLKLGDLGKLQGRGAFIPQIVGTPSQVADELEAMFREEAGDGFMISLFLPSRSF